MGQADLARPGLDPAPNQTGVGDGVVGRPEGTDADRAAVGQEAGHAVDLRHFQDLLERRTGQDRGQAPGEHGLAGARRADHQDVMSAGRGHFQGSLDVRLAFDLPEIGVVNGRLEKVLRFEGRRSDRTGVVQQTDDLA